MDERKGVLFAFMTAIVSGAAVFVNSQVVKGFEPFGLASVRNAMVALMLVVAIVLSNQLSLVRSLTRRQWALLAFIGLIGGGIPFLLYFKGLSLVAGAARASFLYRSLFFIAALLAMKWMGERLSKKVAVGVSVAMLGNVVLMGDAALGEWGAGEALVLGATLMWACEYIISKRVMNREGVEPRLLAFGRMTFGAVVLIAFTAASGLFVPHSYSPVQWQWIIVSSLFLFAFVSFWYVGLANTSVINAASALVLGGPITALLSLAFAGKAPAPAEAFGMFLMAAGSAVAIGYSQLRGAAEFARQKYLARALAWKA